MEIRIRNKIEMKFEKLQPDIQKTKMDLKQFVYFETSLKETKVEIQTIKGKVKTLHIQLQALQSEGDLLV